MINIRVVQRFTLNHVVHSSSIPSLVVVSIAQEQRRQRLGLAQNVDSRVTLTHASTLEQQQQ